MNLNTENAQTIIERDVHCPYCDSDKALLISEIADKRTVLKMPDLDRKYWLNTIFTFGLYAFVHGFPFIEKKRVYDYSTYGFCPHCGKTYNAGVPNSIKTEKRKKVYRSLKDKKIFGICGGIAEYTGRNVKAIRIAMVIYALSVFPAIIYFVLGLTNIMEVNPKQLKELEAYNGGGNFNG